MENKYIKSRKAIMGSLKIVPLLKTVQRKRLFRALPSLFESYNQNAWTSIKWVTNVY